jgi:hypothetical protein
MLERAVSARKRVALVCTVWGETFLKIFCDHCLASLLAPSNLPWASGEYDVTLLVYTRKADLAYLKRHENFRWVSGLVKISFVFLEDLPDSASKGHWLQWQHAVLGQEQFSSYVIIIPDCVYASSLLRKVLGSLKENDIVYYSLPQVCLELILERLYTLRSPIAAKPSAFALDLSELQILSLFIEYINPKHAVALHKPDYFITHPEYLIVASKNHLELIEPACHPLALSGRVKDLSRTFNSLTSGTKVDFLEILGVSCELSLKFIEQYFRWPADRMDLSRTSNLAQWDHHFRQQSSNEYSETETVVTLSGLEALDQEQRRLTKPRNKYLNAAATYHDGLRALSLMAGPNCPREINQLITLAMHAPGFRKAIMSQRAPLTIMLPASIEPSDIFNRIYSLANAEALIGFALVHLVPGNLQIKPGDRFLLQRFGPNHADPTRFRGIEPEMAAHMSREVTGTVLSSPMWLMDRIVVYRAAIKYGSIKNFVQS